MSRPLPAAKAASSLSSLRQVLDEGENVTSIALSDIEIVPDFNPRTAVQTEAPFTPEALHDLTTSIAEHGVLQPLLLRPLPHARYALVAGERRFHASRLAGLKAVPALIREMSAQEAEEFALQENLQRTDLSQDAKALLAIRAVARHMQVPEDQTVLMAGRIKKTGQDPTGLGDMLRKSFGISVSPFAQRYGKFTQLNARERQVILEGRWGISTLIPLTQLADDQQRARLLEQLLSGSISGEEMQRQIARFRRGSNVTQTVDQRLRTALPHLKTLSGEPRLQAERLMEQLLELAQSDSSQAGNR